MKKKILTLVTVCIQAGFCFSQGTAISDIQCTVQPMYRNKSDGKPGREIQIKFINAKLTQKAIAEISGKGFKESTEFIPSAAGDTVAKVLLPNGVGVDRETPVKLTLVIGNKKIKKSFIVSPMRYWNIYLYNHSHVDISYIITHKNV